MPISSLLGLPIYPLHEWAPPKTDNHRPIYQRNPLATTRLTSPARLDQAILANPGLP